MPGADAKLTEADYKLIQAWMAKYKNGHHPCPICEATAWTIAEYLVHPTTQGTGALYPPDSVYPNVLLLSPCGYSRYLNAVMIGLVPARQA